MVYRAFWIVENRVLYIGQREHVTFEDVRFSTQQIADYIDDAYAHGSKLVIGILDLNGVDLSLLVHSPLATAVNEIADVIDPRLLKAKPGFIILVTTSNDTKAIISPIVRLAVQPMTTVGTLHEALTVASYMYPELKDQLGAYRDGDNPTGAAHSD